MKKRLLMLALCAFTFSSCREINKEGINGNLTIYPHSGWSTLDLKDSNGKDTLTMFPGRYTFRLSDISFRGVPYVEILDANGQHKGMVTIPADTIDLKNNSFEYTTDHPKDPYQFNIRGGRYHRRASVWREAKLSQSCTYTGECEESCKDSDGNDSTCEVSCQKSGTQDVLIQHETYIEAYRILFEDPDINTTNIAVFNSDAVQKTEDSTLSSTTCE